MSAEYDTRDLRSELDKKNFENEDLKAQLQEVLSRVSRLFKVLFFSPFPN